ncbi:MAG: NADPH-dependent F420 reductase [Candidatus Baldrarchaeia archaeon]
MRKDVKVEGKVNYEAAAEADIIVFVSSIFCTNCILKSIRGALEPGKILVDVIVPLATAIDGPPTKTLGVWTGSAAKLTEQLVPKGVKVVAAFKNVPADAVQNLDEDVDCDVIVCGDDEEAKRKVMKLAELIPGVRAIDGGPLENAHVIEELTAFLISINIKYGVKNAGIRITGIK